MKRVMMRCNSRKAQSEHKPIPTFSHYNVLGKAVNKSEILGNVWACTKSENKTMKRK